MTLSRPSRSALVGALVGATVFVLSAAQQPPVTPLSLAGLVITPDQDAMPVRGVTVTVTDVAGGTPAQTAETDDTGRFSFAGLPPGRYEVSAVKPGYLRTSVGMTRPERPGTPVTIAAGQPPPNVTLRIWRGAVITGVLRDPQGRPLPSTTVSVRRYQFVNGVRTIVNATVGTTMTDDRGIYRIFGLAPGEYAVFTPAVGPGRGLASALARQTTNDDIERALRGARARGPLGVAGGVSVSSPPAAPPAFGNAPVYFPGTAVAIHATPVRVEAGEERSGIDFALELVPIATIAGIVTPPPGETMANLQVLMSLTARSAPGDLVLTRTATPNPDGTFTLTSVTPGQYLVTARATPRVLESNGSPSRIGWWATASVSVNGVDVTGTVLALEPGVTVAGQVSFDGARPPPRDAIVNVRLTPRSGDQSWSPVLTATAAGSQRVFTIPGIVPGEYSMSATIGPRGTSVTDWVFKGVSVGQQDVSDVTFTIVPGRNPPDVTVSFTSRRTEITGVFQDASGRPAPDYFIVVFPADRRYWQTGSRRIVQARPATDSRFTIVGLPAGEYVVAVTTDLVPGDLDDPAFLDQLLATPTVKVSLEDGARVRQDIRIAAR